METVALILAALALALERAAYVYAWRAPDDFRARSARLGLGGDPTRALERLFYLFKGVQAAVFATWIAYFSGGIPALRDEAAALWGGLALVAIGQCLNLMTFLRLGRLGVFYGVRFGHSVPWCDAFPFSVLRHPQYVGAVLSIWGLFLMTRFPAADWCWLPLLETLYYALGAHFESEVDDAAAVDIESAPEISESSDCA